MAKESPLLWAPLVSIGAHSRTLFRHPGQAGTILLQVPISFSCLALFDTRVLLDRLESRGRKGRNVFGANAFTPAYSVIGAGACTVDHC